MKRKRLSVAGLLTVALLLLTGCVRTTKSGKPYGLTYTYLAKPMQHLMEWLASHLGNNCNCCCCPDNLATSDVFTNEEINHHARKNG